MRAKEGLATTAQVFKILGKMFIFGGETVAKLPPQQAVSEAETLMNMIGLNGSEDFA